MPEYALGTVKVYGEDIWTAYELSWLEPGGKPQVAIAHFRIPSDSECIVESKSFKLYLNSLYSYRAGNSQEIQALLEDDLSQALGCRVGVKLSSVETKDLHCAELKGRCLDDLEVDIDNGAYQIDSNLLKVESGEAEETLYSHLLRSSCPVTGQPDWASVVISYRGQAIEHSGLLRYIVSYRDHRGFHEQCVERIYLDLWKTFRLEYLSVYARYLRRGGLDINPFRSSEQQAAPLWRLTRQ